MPLHCQARRPVSGIQDWHKAPAESPSVAWPDKRSLSAHQYGWPTHSLPPLSQCAGQKSQSQSLTGGAAGQSYE